MLCVLTKRAHKQATVKARRRTGPQADKQRAREETGKTRPAARSRDGTRGGGRTGNGTGYRLGLVGAVGEGERGVSDAESVSGRSEVCPVVLPLAAVLDQCPELSGEPAHHLETKSAAEECVLGD